MSYKLSRLIFTALVAAVGVIAIAGSASAQSIPGTFFGITNTNTGLQEEITRVSLATGEPVGTRFSSTVSGGTEFLDGGGFAALWEQRTVELSEGGNPLFNSLGYTGVGGDLPIVTTLTGLQQGTYDVEFIYISGTGVGDQQYATGFSAASTSQVAGTVGANSATRYLDVDHFFGDAAGSSLATQSTFGVFGSLIGNATVGSDGVLQVFSEDLGVGVANNNLTAFAGLSLVQTSAVPEPSSLALLGLFAGVGLIRRRR